MTVEQKKGVIAVGRRLDGGVLRQLRRIAGSRWETVKKDTIGNGTQVFYGRENKIVGFSVGAIVYGDETGKHQVFGGLKGKPQGSIMKNIKMNEGFDSVDKDITHGQRGHNTGLHVKKYSHSQIANANLRKNFIGKKS